MNESMNDDMIKTANELYQKLHPNESPKDKIPVNADHPLYPMYLSVLAVKEVMMILANDENEAFTQLDKGSWNNFYIDETKAFADAMQFALHPYDDIAAELERRGIREKVKTAEITCKKGEEAAHVKVFTENLNELTKIELKDNDDGTVTVIKYIERPLHFENVPLKQLARERMKRRVPANRERVGEMIKLANALSDRINTMSSPTQVRTPVQQFGVEPRRL